MPFPSAFEIRVAENHTISTEADRLHEWFGSLVGAIVWLSNIYTDEHFVFRGQSELQWELTSTLWRHCSATTEANLSSAEDAMIAAIGRDFWFEREFGFAPKPDFRTRALLQHEGIPTRLVDVTADPLVALYFAVTGSASVDAHDREDGAVYLIRRPGTADSLSYEVHSAPQVSPRVTSQRSLFLQPVSLAASGAPRGRPVIVAPEATIDFIRVNCKGASTVTNFEDLVGRFLIGSRVGRPARIAPNIVRFIIPGSAKKSCRSSLWSLGVSGPNLFPGSGGFKRGLREL